jgi:murein L,D-transpeptidase YcbB/YkuD
MRLTFFAAALAVCVLASCKKKDEVKDGKTISGQQISDFFSNYPDYRPFEKDLKSLYANYNNDYLWFDEQGRNDMAEVLYDRARQIEAEGVPVPLPYKDRYAKLFDGRTRASAENDLLISSMYLFYAKKALKGIDPAKSREMGWFLPRKRMSYADYLGKLLDGADDEQHIALYDNLKKSLGKYRKMKAEGQTSDGGIPIDRRIRTIMVNMERCRWLSPQMVEAPEYISVNTPAYHLKYVKDGKTALESDVVVGDEENKTVVFSGKLSYLVFSPYWNIPESIVEKEILPGIEKDSDYLEKHHMEKVGEHYRQKPGDDNSLGLVKFMFPNNNNIYLHDTPAKSLFKKEDRALSHGCVRVAKARGLAIAILKDDPDMTPEKIDAAMHAGEPKEYPLKRKIPVYLTYFTATADENGNATFYDDVYDRDGRVERMLYTE